MESVKLTARTYSIINDMLNDITGYSDARRNNYSIQLSDDDDKINMDIIHNDSNTVLFHGILNEDAFLEAMKIEDAKEKEEEED